MNEDSVAALAREIVELETKIARYESYREKLLDEQVASRVFNRRATIVFVIGLALVVVISFVIFVLLFTSGLLEGLPTWMILAAFVIAGALILIVGAVVVILIGSRHRSARPKIEAVEKAIENAERDLESRRAQLDARQ